jgi:hypothetical protein
MSRKLKLMLIPKRLNTRSTPSHSLMIKDQSIFMKGKESRKGAHHQDSFHVYHHIVQTVLHYDYFFYHSQIHHKVGLESDSDNHTQDQDRELNL